MSRRAGAPRRSPAVAVDPRRWRALARPASQSAARGDAARRPAVIRTRHKTAAYEACRPWFCDSTPRRSAAVVNGFDTSTRLSDRCPVAHATQTHPFAPLLLAAQRGISRVELVHLHNQLVWHELDEPAVVGVGPAARLARALGCVVGQRDPQRAALASVELIHVTRHAGRDLPARDGRRIEQRLVDARARRMMSRLISVEDTTTHPDIAAALARDTTGRGGLLSATVTAAWGSYPDLSGAAVHDASGPSHRPDPCL